MRSHPLMVDASSPGPKVCAACGREADEPCYDPAADRLAQALSLLDRWVTPEKDDPEARIYEETTAFLDAVVPLDFAKEDE